MEFKSRQVIANNIEWWDLKTAMWYLERKRRSEFSINHIENKEGIDDTEENPLSKRLKELWYY